MRKKTRKAAAIITSAVLCMGMAVTAFADSPITDKGGYDSRPVTGTYVQGSGDAVYSVDVVWDSMEFTYTAAGEGTWNPVDHTYDGQGEDPGWSSTSNTITVTNHSNQAVTAALTFEVEPAYSTKITGSFTDADGNPLEPSELKLASAAEVSLGDWKKAPTASAKLSLSGDPESFEESQMIGKVTVTIADAAQSQ